MRGRLVRGKDDFAFDHPFRMRSEVQRLADAVAKTLARLRPEANALQANQTRLHNSAVALQTSRGYRIKRLQAQAGHLRRQVGTSSIRLIAGSKPHMKIRALKWTGGCVQDVSLRSFNGGVSDQVTSECFRGGRMTAETAS